MATSIIGVYPEMVDPQTCEYLGNLPQGLTHLAVIQALATLASPDDTDNFSH
ncbi:hypothetical protein [Paraburkholderia acidisoli]|uniref:Uncharacterized protein n=1 Tax=Paraburkholderia acidisoli TaxID=2571748 RepID=A0A7Z2GSC8_9BURK|nr:hypothetical protein [Paraburkholderia acidisoli]QGZ67067.1 hypothetical protein FAZ98_35155 [Paraburkholderia acidisoli]